MCRVVRGNEAEDQPGRTRRRDREGKRREVERQIEAESVDAGRAYPADEAHAERGHGDTGGACERAENESLDDELCHQARPARAQREAQRDLATTLRRAGQEHTRYVDRGDEKQEERRGEQDERRPTDDLAL
jgi:hypothetical protein